MTTLLNKSVREKDLQMNKLAVLCRQGGSYQKKDIKKLCRQGSVEITYFSPPSQEVIFSRSSLSIGYPACLKVCCDRIFTIYCESWIALMFLFSSTLCWTEKTISYDFHPLVLSVTSRAVFKSIAICIFFHINVLNKLNVQWTRMLFQISHVFYSCDFFVPPSCRPTVCWEEECLTTYLTLSKLFPFLEPQNLERM